MPRPRDSILSVLVLTSALVGCSSFSDGTSAPPPDPVPDGSTPVDASVVPGEAGADGGDPPGDGGPPECMSRGRACSDRYVFLTPGQLRGGFAALLGAGMTAQERADGHCQKEANVYVKFPDLAGRTWKAWLCSSTSDAVDRLPAGEARWIGPDGETVFATRASVAGGAPLRPIGDGPAWTGCQADGRRNGATRCAEWVSNADVDTAAAGDAASTSSSWANAGERSCGMQASIYCFEDAAQ